jgi:D-alanyl-D-alanine carboxypeptidase
VGDNPGSQLTAVSQKAFSVGTALWSMPAFITIVMVTVFQLTAIPLHADSVDDFINAELRRQNVPALSLAVVKDGVVVKRSGYGFADLTRQVPATADTAYKIGSISKTLLATGVMLLVRDGQLSLEDTVTRFLPDAPVSWQGITVRHLLTHTSGLPRNEPGFRRQEVQEDIEVIRSAYDTPLLFKPGEQWSYSNVGYRILGEVIRVATKQPWDAFLRQRILDPLGMTNTVSVTSTGSASRAVGYSKRRGEGIVEAAIEPFAHPGGGLVSTVGDLALWDAGLYTDKIIDTATRELMWSPVKLNDGSTHPYGLGWELDSISRERQIRHGGDITGYLSQFVRSLDEHLTVIVLTNVDDCDIQQFARGVINIFVRGSAEAN